MPYPMKWGEVAKVDGYGEEGIETVLSQLNSEYGGEFNRKNSFVVCGLLFKDKIRSDNMVVVLLDVCRLSEKKNKDKKAEEEEYKADAWSLGGAVPYYKAYDQKGLALGIRGNTKLFEELIPGIKVPQPLPVPLELTDLVPACYSLVNGNEWYTLEQLLAQVDIPHRTPSERDLRVLGPDGKPTIA